MSVDPTFAVGVKMEAGVCCVLEAVGNKELPPVACHQSSVHFIQTFLLKKSQEIMFTSNPEVRTKDQPSHGVAWLPGWYFPASSQRPVTSVEEKETVVRIAPLIAPHFPKGKEKAINAHEQKVNEEPALNKKQEMQI